jgi:hypothetical protein
MAKLIDPWLDFGLSMLHLLGIPDDGDALDPEKTIKMLLVFKIVKKFNNFLKRLQFSLK